MPKKPAASSFDVKFAILDTPVESMSDRAPIIVPAAAFVETVELVSIIGIQITPS